MYRPIVRRAFTTLRIHCATRRTMATPIHTDHAQSLGTPSGDHAHATATPPSDHDQSAVTPPDGRAQSPNLNLTQSPTKPKTDQSTENLNEMLKSMKKFGNTETLRHVKHKAKMRGRLPVSGVISLQICGVGGYDSSRALILSTDHNKYLFNCGEGTQRLINEHKMKASRLEHIFITHQSWQNVGGLLGLALTLQAVNVPLITIHGPPNVERGVHMSKNFADMKAAGVQKVELEKERFRDHSFAIDTVILRPTRGVGETESKKTKLDYEKDIAVAYICRPHLYPRKVDLSKCVDLGIKTGPILGKLKAGEVVTLEDGRRIEPDQILGEQLPSRPLLVVEIPRMEYLDALLQSEVIGKLQSGSMNGSSQKSHAHESSDPSNEEAEIVVHMSDTEIINTDQYRAWMDKFSPSTKHLTFDPAQSGPTSRSPYRYQTMLNQIHPIIFPLLHLQTRTSDQNWSQQNIDKNSINVASNLVYNYRPKKEFDTTGVVVLDNNEYIEESHAQPEFTTKLEELKTGLASIENVYSETMYPHIVFLGTGSSVPSNTRNVSAILLHLDSESCLLFDCGEGTLGQLWRFYGPETSDILRKLRGILISHLHADHHLGVFSLLLERYKLFHEEEDFQPLDIIGPANYKRWADSFLSEFVPVERCMTHYENHLFLPEKPRESNYSELLLRIGLKGLKSVNVKHCKGSFGFVVELTDGKRITYSGDTMPCEDLIREGKDSDLLIHEATMENDLVEEARRKTHSTTSEAIQVGAEMGAKFTLLTHFSQRYAKIPVFGEEFTDKVGIAFDNMRVDFNQLRLLPRFNPALKALFAEHYAEMEANIEKRQIKARALEMAAKSADTVSQAQ